MVFNNIRVILKMMGCFECRNLDDGRLLFNNIICILLKRMGHFECRRRHVPPMWGRVRVVACVEYRFLSYRGASVWIGGVGCY